MWGFREKMKGNIWAVSVSGPKPNAKHGCKDRDLSSFSGKGTGKEREHAAACKPQRCHARALNRQRDPECLELTERDLKF